MRNLLRYAMLVLVLLIVAMISAVTAMRLAIHGQEVAVPSLVGMSPAEAEKALSAHGLQMVIERQYYSAQVPEGKIVSQLPTPDTKVRHGWQVRVAQSLGPTRVTIPDVTGESERAAELNIRRRGLDVASEAQVDAPGIPADQVVAQSPAANATQVAEPKINLLVTTAAQPDSFVMPSFVGQPLGTATQTLRDAGFVLGNVSLAPAPSSAAGSGSTGAGTPSITLAAPPPQVAPASIIVLQSPPAGQKVTAGATINFEVR